MAGTSAGAKKGWASRRKGGKKVKLAKDIGKGGSYNAKVMKAFGVKNPTPFIPKWGPGSARSRKMSAEIDDGARYQFNKLAARR